jgi:hypothetical protein
MSTQCCRHLIQKRGPVGQEQMAALELRKGLGGGGIERSEAVEEQ